MVRILPKVIFLPFKNSCIKNSLITVSNIFERLTNRVYIQIAISGHKYCTSSFEIIENFARFPQPSIIIETITSLITFVGVISVSFMTGYITYKHIIYMNIEVINPIYVASIFGGVAVILSYSLFNIYKTVVITVHYCVCHDVTEKQKEQLEPTEPTEHVALRTPFCTSKKFKTLS
ncbi:hypothetical protein HZS_4982, partial [Henneguya salminicola]